METSVKKLYHVVIETHVLGTISTHFPDRRREIYGKVPTLCRATAFTWVTDSTNHFWMTFSHSMIQVVCSFYIYKFVVVFSALSEAHLASFQPFIF